MKGPRNYRYITNDVSRSIGVATMDHPVHIFDFGTGFTPDVLPVTVLPFLSRLGNETES